MFRGGPNISKYKDGGGGGGGGWGDQIFRDRQLIRLTRQFITFIIIFYMFVIITIHVAGNRTHSHKI